MDDKIRHLLIKQSGCYWNPSKTLRALGLTPERLGRDVERARKRAIELNALADAMRREKRGCVGNGPLPGTVAMLFRSYLASEEFGERKPRTQKDYAYYLSKVESEFGTLPAVALTPRVLKSYYRRLVKEKGITWAYHVIGTLRAALTWGVSEEWFPDNAALKFPIKNPRKRTVQWSLEETDRYIVAAHASGRPSLAAMAQVFDSIGQSPIDLRLLKRKDYDGRTIDVTREKTGVGDAPIPLFPEAKEELDRYLGTRPALHPEAPLFANENTGYAYGEQALLKAHRRVRVAAGLRVELQLQDFRRTAQSEGGAAGGTADELRGLARHSTRTSALHYVHPDARYIEAVQGKRLALRERSSSVRKKSEKSGT